MAELREDFTAVPDGTPATTAPTGQAMVDYAPFGAPSVLCVRDGFLSTVDPPNAAFGSYRIAELEQDVVRCGAQFAFTPWTVVGGVLALSVQATSIATDLAVPVSALHLQITPTGWQVDVNDTAGTAVEVIATGTFATPLTADGATLHTVEAILDRDRGACYLLLPDGQTVTLTDPRFSLAGRWVYVEPFKGAGLATLTSALIRSWWASSGVDDIPHLRATASRAASVVTAYPNPGTATLVADGADVMLPGSTITVTHGPTGGALIFVEVYLGVSNPSDPGDTGRLDLWVYRDNTRLTRRTLTASQGVNAGLRQVTIPVLDTPGARRTYQIALRATAPLAATLVRGSVSQHHGNQVVTATPY